jgi:hypothetical protein
LASDELVELERFLNKDKTILMGGKGPDIKVSFE